MGYYAQGHGELKLNSYGKTHHDELWETIDIDFEPDIEEDVVYLSFAGNYHEEDVINTLKEISKFVEQNQEVYFYGEDRQNWRFVFRSDGLYEENAELTWINPGWKR